MDSIFPVLIFSQLLSFEIVSACLQGGCRELAFPAYLFFADKRLVNHTIRTIKVRDMDHCELLCYFEANCVSFNFENKVSSVETSYNCDLNNSTHRRHDGDFVDEKGYFYRGADSVCDTVHCKNGGTCQSGFTDKRYCCLCPPGFTGDDCEQDVDECAQNIHNCSSDAVCNNTKGAYNCTCRPGYNGDGRNCTDVDECAQNTHNCSADAVCNNTNGAYNCTCKPGYHGDGLVCAGMISCLDIKSKGHSHGDGVYWLDPDGGSHSNAFLAYCDMTSYGGGWTMCYTTDEYAEPKTEVTYNPQFPYGSVGYRTNCNNIQFKEIIFVDHETGEMAYFKQHTHDQMPIIAADNYGKKADSYGLWKGVEATMSTHSYQLLICDHSFYSGFFVSGYTNCYKQCNTWCGDTKSPYFRTSSTSTSYKGVAFNTNGHQPLGNRLMSVGLREG